MIFILYGALGVVCVLALMAGGFAAGWQARKTWVKHTRRVAAEEASEEERRRLREEQKAFEGMLNYNAETAYGLAGGLEETEGSEL